MPSVNEKPRTLPDGDKKQESGATAMRDKKRPAMQFVDTKYTDISRTSSASFKPPMTKEPLRKNVPAPNNDSSWFGPIYYIKSLFGGRSATNNVNVMNENKKKNTVSNTPVRTTKPKSDNMKKEIQPGNPKITREELEKMPTLLADDEQLTSPKLSINEMKQRTPPVAALQLDQPIEPLASKFSSTRRTENNSTFLHTPEKKGTTSFRITTNPKIGPRPCPTLLSPTQPVRHETQKKNTKSTKMYVSPPDNRSPRGRNNGRLRSRSSPEAPSTRPRLVSDSKSFSFKPKPTYTMRLSNNTNENRHVKANPGQCSKPFFHKVPTCLDEHNYVLQKSSTRESDSASRHPMSGHKKTTKINDILAISKPSSNNTTTSNVPIKKFTNIELNEMANKSSASSLAKQNDLMDFMPYQNTLHQKPKAQMNNECTDSRLKQGQELKLEKADKYCKTETKKLCKSVETSNGHSIISTNRKTLHCKEVFDTVSNPTVLTPTTFPAGLKSGQKHRSPTRTTTRSPVCPQLSPNLCPGNNSPIDTKPCESTKLHLVSCNPHSQSDFVSKRVAMPSSENHSMNPPTMLIYETCPQNINTFSKVSTSCSDTDATDADFKLRKNDAFLISMATPCSNVISPVCLLSNPVSSSQSEEESEFRLETVTVNESLKDSESNNSHCAEHDETNNALCLDNSWINEHVIISDDVIDLFLCKAVIAQNKNNSSSPYRSISNGRTLTDVFTDAEENNSIRDHFSPRLDTGLIKSPSVAENRPLVDYTGSPNNRSAEIRPLRPFINRKHKSGISKDEKVTSKHNMSPQRPTLTNTDMPIPTEVEYKGSIIPNTNQYLHQRNVTFYPSKKISSTLQYLQRKEVVLGPTLLEPSTCRVKQTASPRIYRASTGVDSSPRITALAETVGSVIGSISSTIQDKIPFLSRKTRSPTRPTVLVETMSMKATKTYISSFLEEKGMPQIFTSTHMPSEKAPDVKMSKSSVEIAQEWYTKIKSGIGRFRSVSPTRDISPVPLSSTEIAPPKKNLPEKSPRTEKAVESKTTVKNKGEAARTSAIERVSGTVPEQTPPKSKPEQRTSGQVNLNKQPEPNTIKNNNIEGKTISKMSTRPAKSETEQRTEGEASPKSQAEPKYDIGNKSSSTMFATSPRDTEKAKFKKKKVISSIQKLEKPGNRTSGMMLKYDPAHHASSQTMMGEIP